MKKFKKAFIDLAIEQQVLRFGEFTLKSGRVSPYFFNAGLFYTGEALAKLGRFYARMITEHQIQSDVLFGPAYKGIPLCSATSIALFEHHQINMPWAFNRKEAKIHGEGGNLVGAPISGRVLLIDDVMTAGTAIRESMLLLHRAGAEPAGVLVMLDRQERGQQGGLSAMQEVSRDYQIPTHAIITLLDLIDYLEEKGQDLAVEHAPHLLDRIWAYRKQYGVEA